MNLKHRARNSLMTNINSILLTQACRVFCAVRLPTHLRMELVKVGGMAVSSCFATGDPCVVAADV